MPTGISPATISSGKPSEHDPPVRPGLSCSLRTDFFFSVSDTPDSDTVLNQIQSSDRFSGLVEEMAEHFHDDAYKDDRIPEIKSSLLDTAREHGLSDGEAQGVAGRLIGTLMQNAAQEAPPPPEEAHRPPYHPEEIEGPPDKSKVTWSLLDIVRDPIETLSDDSDEAVPVLKDGVQRALIAIACVYAADAAANEVPPGFTGQFEKAMTGPSPGGLMNFVNWASARSFSDTLGPLQAYVDDYEKSGDGWFSRLATLRNRWAHPDEYDVDVTLEETRDTLSDPPSFVTADTLALLDSGSVHWIGAPDATRSLASFLKSDGTDLYVPEELSASHDLQFASTPAHSKGSFASAWHELRVADTALENPTPREFHAKLKTTSSPAPDDAAEPGRLGSFFDASPPGLLTVPSLSTPVRLSIKKRWPDAECLQLSLDEDASLLTTLPDLLGLSEPPSWKELCTFQEEKPFGLIIETMSLDSDGFLNLLYELADLHDTCAPAHLKIVFLRSAEQIETDQSEIWDRLPSHLSELLHAPSSNPALKLVC